MKFKIFTAIVLVSSSILAFAANNPGRGRMPEWAKPIKATDVVLGKKITARGKPANPRKPSHPSLVSAATGELGGEPFNGTKYAIIIGIADYPGTANDLNYSDDDADYMEDVLYYYGITAYTKIQNSDATGQAIIDAFEEAAAYDEVVFYYSGHGVNGIADDGDREKKDEGIVLWENGTDEGGYSFIWDGQLKQAFQDLRISGVQRIVCIFDTCYSGGMISDLSGVADVILTSTTENNLAYELSTIGAGEFTYYLTDGILIGNAHIDSHNYDDVTVEEAYDYCVLNCSYDKPCIGDYFDNDLLP